MTNQVFSPRTPQELLEKADQILQKVEKREKLDSRTLANHAAYAKAHVQLALAMMRMEDRSVGTDMYSGT